MSIEHIPLEFSVTVHHVRFSHLGQYYLELNVQNSAVDAKKLLSNVQHSINNGELVLGAKAKTDIIEQVESDQQLSFLRSRIRFVFPPGFCKNDISHDVRLLVEAFQVKDKRSNTGSRVSQNTIAIYPRTNEPKVNVNAGPTEYMFSVNDEFSLLRTPSGDPIQVHAGRISLSYYLKEYIEVFKADTPPPAPSNRNPPVQPQPLPRRQAPPPREPEPDTLSEISIDQGPPSDAGVSMDDAENMNFFLENSPAPSREAVSVNPGGEKKGDPAGDFLLPEKGSEYLMVKIHAGFNLPGDETDERPSPYAVLRVVSDEEGVKAEAVTKSVASTHHPYWDESFLLSYRANDSSDDHYSAVFVVADASSKKSLSTYKFDLNNLQPFVQYHLDLSKISSGVSGADSSLYVSVMRVESSLPREFPATPYLAVETTLVQMSSAIKPNSCYYAARVVPDANRYIREMLKTVPRPAGVRTQSVLFPKPLPEAFRLPQGHLHGYPQVTIPSEHKASTSSSSDPESNTSKGNKEKGGDNKSMLFVPNKDLPSLFTVTSALVVEVYGQKGAMGEDVGWSLHSPLAYSVLPLNRTLYHRLLKAPNHALTVISVPLVQNSSKQQSSPEFISIMVRLIESDDTKRVLSGAGVDTVEYSHICAVDDVSLDSGSTVQSAPRKAAVPPTNDQHFPPWKPILGAHTLPQPAAAPRNRNTLRTQPLNTSELPPEESMSNLLGAGERGQPVGDTDGYVYRVPKGDAPPPPIGAVLDDYDTESFTRDRYQRPAAGEFDDRAMRIIDLQMQDLENYRRAVKKMSEDILKLREQVSKVESHNSQLRRQITMGEESSKALLNVAELEGISKADLIDRYIALRRKLAEHSNEVKVYKDKVQILQNQVIKKNDKEKSYIQLQQAHTAQQALLMKYQDKSAKFKNLEETVKAQEKVIAKMEKLMQQKGRTLKDADDQRQKIEEALKMENDRLRAELRKEREAKQLMEQQQADKAAGEVDITPVELARLRNVEADLEERDMRNMALHKALEDNSRMWGREKEELLRRITELERGFARSPVMILGHPSINSKPHQVDRVLSPHYRPKNWPSRLEPIS